MLTQKLVPGRRPDVYIPGQATHAYILIYWYLVPLIKPPWAAALYSATSGKQADENTGFMVEGHCQKLSELEQTEYEGKSEFS